MRQAVDELVIPAHLSASDILENPLLNKGTAFTQDERDALGLNGLLPARVETLEEQVARCVETLQALPTQLDRYIYMRELQDTNETLHYAVVAQDMYHILPIIYTPTVGAACQKYSHLYRRARGLFLTPEHQDQLDAIFANPRFDQIECIVVTDGERILGLGDQGADGMGIPVGKLAIYTGCGGIAPETTLAVTLDTGSNNSPRRADPRYLGWQHDRVRGEAYDNFVEAFIQAVHKRWPKALLQWEDFHKQNATRLLEKYRDRLCNFNDDIQGTAAVAVGALLAAVNQTGLPLTEQRVLIVGGGSAGCGIADLCKYAMVKMGLSREAADARFFIVDQPGLLTEDIPNLEPFQQCHVQRNAALADWTLDQPGRIALADVVRNAKPTVLVGVSGQAGIFTEAIIREMASHAARPVIFPMSNPTACIEAQPADLVRWTDGRAIIGTGSPFEPVEHNGKVHHFAQCNNAYVFPGLGLGAIAVEARAVTEDMLITAAQALADLSPAKQDPNAKLLPEINELREVSRQIAVAVAKEARNEGLTAALSDTEIEARVNAKMWAPVYRRYRRA